jgi:hypothetical protein
VDFDDSALLDFRAYRMINVRPSEMHFCKRPREDPGNLKTVYELYGSKEMGVIAGCGTDHQKVGSMDPFQTPYILLHSKNCESNIALRISGVKS